MFPLYTWALALLTALQPPAETPWSDTYPATAIAIVDEAQAHPVFPGDDGVVKTIALDVAVAWFESRFRPDAAGDGGASLGLYQTATSFARPEALTDPAQATAIAQRLFVVSFQACASRPSQDALGWYADGGPGCGRPGERGERARRKSATRLALASRLLRDHPPPPIE